MLRGVALWTTTHADVWSWNPFPASSTTMAPTSTSTTVKNDTMAPRNAAEPLTEDDRKMEIDLLQGLGKYGKLGTCRGEQVEQRTCMKKECTKGDCIDCKWGQWEEWGQCQPCVSLKERRRSIAAPNNYCGKPCEGEKIQTTSCDDDECEPDQRDCVMDEWSAWSKCDAVCGGGQMFRDRKILKQLRKGGIPCDGDEREAQPCNVQPCSAPQDCELEEWSAWDTCSASCEGGMQERTRKIKTVPSNGGQGCNDALSEVRGCNVFSCAESADCEWATWTEWSGCSRKCGGGSKTRMRGILTIAINGGKQCEAGATVEKGVCNSHPCEKVVDCELRAWSEWSDCSCTCNGIKNRHRSIDVYPSNGGKICAGPLREIEACNVPQVGKDGCEAAVDNAEMAVDCKLSAWGEWGECSKSCDHGITRRQRLVVVEPQNGGKQCDGVLEEVRGCNPEACADEANIEEKQDCEVSAWGNWGSCSADCNGGTRKRIRNIAKEPTMWGASCLSVSLEEIEPCNLLSCDDCIDCIFGAWAEWTPCSCKFLSERSRNIQRVSNYCGKPCEGARRETRSCKMEDCEEERDCQISEWSEWGECSALCGGGQRSKTREITRMALNGGKHCEANTKVTEACGSETCMKPVDCRLEEWSEWSVCTAKCAGGQKYRSRKFVEGISGKGCEDSLKEVTGCNEDPCEADRNCEWGEWTDFGDCSVTCGGGYRSRDRHVAVAPRGNGKACEARVKEEIQPCNQQSCRGQCLDSKWGSWGEWSDCSGQCGQTYRFRSRKVAVLGNHCGKQLEGAAEEYENCPAVACNENPIDCAFSDWSYWGDCTCTCDGIKERTRRIVTTAFNGGKACTGAVKEVHPCNVAGTQGAKCLDHPPVSCELDQWSPWSTCTAECSGGTSQRERKILTPSSFGGTPCQAPLKEIISCNEQKCHEAVDCEWLPWAEWSACTRECEGGQTSRYRHIMTLSQHGGKLCQAKDSKETRACNEHSCGKVNYCAWGQWQDWSECSTECGTGSSTRARVLQISTSMPDSTIYSMGSLNLIDGPEAGNSFSWATMMGTFVAGILMSGVVLTGSRALQNRFSRHRGPQFVQLSTALD